MRITLNPDETVFQQYKRGLMVVSGDTDTFYQFYIPRVNMMRTTEYGKTVTVKFGNTLTLVMPTGLFNTNRDAIVKAALGEDVL